MGTDIPTATTSVPESAAVLSARAAAARPPAAPGRVQILLCLSAFLAALNFFAPTPFYPQMARDLQTTVPLLGQVVTLMALISAGLGLLAGPLADRYGYRWPLVMGLLAIARSLSLAFIPKRRSSQTTVHRAGIPWESGSHTSVVRWRAEDCEPVTNLAI